MDTVEVTFRNIDPTDAIREFAEKRVEKLHKYLQYDLAIHVLLTVENRTHKAEVTCHAEHKDWVATGESENLYESIDLAVERMENQLRKERDRKKGHHTAHQVLNGGEHLAQDIEAEVPHAAKIIKR